MPSVALKTHHLRFASSTINRAHGVCRSRPFHASRPNQVFDGAFSLSHDIFQAVHSFSGLPWGYSLCLTGVFFRLAFFPINYIVDRNVKRQQLYAPLSLAWQTIYKKEAIALQRKGVLEAGPAPANAWMKVASQGMDKVLSSKYAYKSWLPVLPLGFIPVWIVNTMVIRRMIGINKIPMDSAMAEPSSTAALGSYAIPVEPSMIGETLLWVPDITSADPLFILPITVWALSGLSFYLNIRNATWRTAVEIRAIPQVTGRLRARMLKSLQTIGWPMIILMGPFIIYNEIPSALCLYWACGTATLLFEKQYLKRRFGIKAIMPAKPLPARMKTRRSSSAGRKAVN